MIEIHTIEIITGKQLIFDNIPLITLTKQVTDELLLIELLYLKFKDRIKLIDLEKKNVYGIQFYRFDWSERMKTTKIWTNKYEVHIFSELGFFEIKELFRLIGYKLSQTEKDRLESINSYKLFLLKK